MDTKLIIEDHVVPQLFTTAIEAYEFEHKTHKKGKSNSKLETFGLLWGYSIPQKGDLPSRIVSTLATVETSALRHQEWVEPNLESLLTKKIFFEKYYPNVELIGTFHSHPYANLDEVQELKGWRASDGDEEFWPWLHEFLCPEQDQMAHLVVTVSSLNSKGWASPSRLKGSENKRGYVLSAEYRKLWLNSYLTTSNENKDDGQKFKFSKNLTMDIPSLENRFWD